MDKISGILPSTARVTTVDLKDSPISRAVNPGVKADPMSRLPAETPNRLQPADMLTGAPWKTKDEKRAAIVTDVASSFFMKGKPEIQTGEEVVQESAPLAQPEGLYPKGFFIDRNA